MKIITVSREFGSGGRELGKRLSDALGFAYYDKEIITAVAEKLSMDEAYLERVSERGILSTLPLNFSRTLNYLPSSPPHDSYLLAQQHKIIKELASKGDCIIVGRGADAVLQQYNPFTLFVFADMPAKIKRCQDRAAADDPLTQREWARKIKQVDKARANDYALFSPCAWGDMHTYHLCVNTTNTEIKSMVPSIAAYARSWYEGKSL